MCAGYESRSQSLRQTASTPRLNNMQNRTLPHFSLQVEGQNAKSPTAA